MKNSYAQAAVNAHVNSIALAGKTKITDTYLKFSLDPKNECGLTNIADKGIQAGLLNNFQKIMDSEEANSVTHSQSYGPYVMEVWPVVTAWYPEFPLKDLISVQDMAKPLAYLFFSRLLIGTDKGLASQNDHVETPTGTRVIKGTYPTGEIIQEAMTVEDFTFDDDADEVYVLLAYSPLNLNANAEYTSKIKITITQDGGTTDNYYHSISNTTIQLGTKSEGVVTPVSGLTLDSLTGLLTIPETNGGSHLITEIVASYVWNIDYATEENIPKVKEDIELVPIEAVPRGIAMEWTLFSEYLKKSQFGTDIREENTKRILSLLYQFQVRYILDDLYDYAEGTPVSIEITGGTAISLDVKAQVLSQALKEVANTIEVASGRSEGNRIVTGKTLKTFLESLPNTLFQPVAQPSGYSSPREIGTFGTFKVYYDPTRSAGEAFMTYRGTEWYDAAYYMGVFLPIVPTDAIALGVKVRQSFISMEAYKYHKKTTVIPLVMTQGA